jgi:S1-C subfamily serine protease
MSNALIDLSNALADTVAAAAAGVVRVEGRRRMPASGIIWSGDGLVVTANHVVQRDEDIAVGLPDGHRVPAAVLGRDPTTDLAVLRVQASDLAVPAWAEGDAARLGAIVLGLGRPGESAEVSPGHITALGGPWLTGAGGRVDRHFRTSIVMLPGFSGGPAVLADGRVVGLATSGLTREGDALLPAETVRRVVAALVAHGRVRRGYLGVTANPVRLPEGLSPDGHGVGLMLAAVEPDSPAARGGLALGDVIIALDGLPVRRMDELLALLTDNRVGQTVQVRVLRGGQPIELAVTVGERPDES